MIGDNAANQVTEAGDDRLEGGGGADTLFGDNVALDETTLVGTVGGADDLSGNEGEDTLRAGPGDDRLDGGPEFDRCAGDGGTDAATECEQVTGIP
ncbi:MAG: hypothetical protein LC722_07375 [Actinobacteria bacterium]|nr:hypothetical protein [Actinomycetota bacterium]